MRTSFGIGSIQLVFKDLPAIAAHYIALIAHDETGDFNHALGGPIERVTTQAEASMILSNPSDIMREHPASKDHYEVLYFNNNSGGPTYVIPKDFVSELIDLDSMNKGA